MQMQYRVFLTKMVADYGKKCAKKTCMFPSGFCHFFFCSHSTPASSVPIEGYFSIFGLVWSNLCNHLGDDRAMKLVQVYQHLATKTSFPRRSYWMNSTWWVRFYLCSCSWNGYELKFCAMYSWDTMATTGPMYEGSMIIFTQWKHYNCFYNTAYVIMLYKF